MNPRRSVSAPSCRSAKMRAHAERAADLVADDDAAERRRQDDGRRRSADALGDRAAERLGLRRMLQHERALQVAGAVQAGGQAEMPFEQRAGRRKRSSKSSVGHHVSEVL